MALCNVLYLFLRLETRNFSNLSDSKILLIENNCFREMYESNHSEFIFLDFSNLSLFIEYKKWTKLPHSNLWSMKLKLNLKLMKIKEIIFFNFFLINNSYAYLDFTLTWCFDCYLFSLYLAYLNLFDMLKNKGRFHTRKTYWFK